MRKGAATASAIVHLALIAILVFGLPEFARPLPEEEPYSIEIVDVITDVANPPPPLRVKTPIPPSPDSKPLPPAEVLTPAAPSATAAVPAPDVAPTPPPAPVPTPPAPKPKPPAPTEVAEVKPPDPVKSDVPEPEAAKPVPEKPKPEKPKPEPEKPKPEPEKPKPEKPKPAPEKPKPEKPKPAKPKPDKPLDLDDLDALLNDNADKPRGSPPPPGAVESPTPNRETTNRNNPDKPLSNSEKGAIIAQLQQCWRVDMGMAGVDSMWVTWEVRFERNGALVGQPKLTKQSPNASPAFIDSAYRAFFKCNPLKNLPGIKYDSWKFLEITFDPRSMSIGG